MAVYKQSGPIQMFIRIAINNLMVDIKTFFSGLIVGIGSFLVLIYNGMMLSAFQFYFIKRGLFWDSFLAVWLHGTLEISAMVICGAAGIVLGKGIVFPGTYSRTQSFFSSAQRGTKIFFSVLPITFTAAIIESFLTRYTEAPDILRLSLIIISLLFILGYYVYLPWLKKRNGTLRIPEAEKVLAENFSPFEFYTIKNVSKNILDTFILVRKYAGSFATTIFIFVILFIVIGFTLNKEYLLEDIYYTQWTLYNLNQYFIANSSNWFAILFPILLNVLSIQICYIFYREKCEQINDNYLTAYEWLTNNIKNVILNLIVQTIFYATISMLGLDTIVFLFVIPLQFICTFAIFFPYKNQKSFIVTFFKSMKNGVMNLFIINLAFLLFSLALFLLLSTSIYWLVYEAITINLTNDIINSDYVYLIFFLIATTSIVTLSFISFCLYQGIFYFSQKEKNTAEGLIEQLDYLGKRNRRYVFPK
jgi:uncharacterized membrane protein SpoIIM required for sporulation